MKARLCLLSMMCALALAASGCDLVLSVDRSLASRVVDAGTDDEKMDEDAAVDSGSVEPDAGHDAGDEVIDAGSDAGDLVEDAGSDAGEDAAVSCVDGDADGICTLVDVCPTVADPAQGDSDHDGVGDACDACPSDARKVITGVCGCGVAETDTVSDGAPDCVDACPVDPKKSSPGVCGCGIPNTDSDSDGTADCLDVCLHDANKTTVGICGCGFADTDFDTDGVADCMDACPLDNPDDSDGDDVCDSEDACAGDDASGDTDHDGLCDDLDPCDADAALSDCSGTCFDLGTDHDHCGTCATVCGASELCTAGDCVFAGAPLSFTLTWNEPTADLDIYVKTPNGGLIYFGNTSADGGTMYTDSMSGPGAEQIVWPAAPPSGTYEVCAVAFDVSADAAFSLEVSKVGSLAQSVTGTRVAADVLTDVTACDSGDASHVLSFSIP